MIQRIYWFLCTVLLFVGSLALLTACYASAVDGVALAVPVLCCLVAIPSFISLMVQLLVNRRIRRKDLAAEDKADDLLPLDDTKTMLNLMESGLRPSAQSVALFVAPSVSLFLVILLRLTAGADNFQGDPALLDFGPKDGIEDGERNVAFTPEFNSYGHCLQGVLAAILAFPAVSGLLTQCLTCQICRRQSWWTECNKVVWSIIKLTGCFMTIYPTYNLVKRLIRSGETFATSSFCNNAFEWAFGFMVGLALGNLITVMVKRAFILTVHRNGTAFQEALDRADGESWVMGSTQKQQPAWYPKVNGFQFLLGIILMFTVFTASVFFGLTWHSCGEGSEDCVNYSEDGLAPEVLAAFVIIPTFIILLASCGECMRFRR